MDRTINRISEIEYASEKILSDANSRKQEIARLIQGETEKFDAGLEANTSNFIEVQKHALEQQLKKDLDELYARSEAALTALNEHYEQYRGDYVSRLFRKMTEV